MTKISIYSVDQNIGGNDKWIGSDAQNNQSTKNFTPTRLAEYFNNNNVVDIGLSIRYRYQTLDPGEQRAQGTISFETELGPQVNFSAISTFLLAKNTLKQNNVSQYLDFLVGSKVIISKASNINIFGYYTITAIEPYIPDTNFFVVALEFISGNGFMYEDLDYLISLVDKNSGDITIPNLQQVVTVGGVVISTDGLKKVEIDKDNGYIKISTRPTTGDAWVLRGLFSNVLYSQSLDGNSYSYLQDDNVYLVDVLNGVYTYLFPDRFEINGNIVKLPTAVDVFSNPQKLALKPILNSEDFTAELGVDYETDQDLTVGDPDEEIGSYRVFVSNNTVTIGGVDYPKGSRIYRYYDGTAWNTIQFIDYELAQENFYPLNSNPAGYLTQQEVEEYPSLASFPPTGIIGTIYIALNTGLFYTWNGTTYILSAAPDTGITGGGIVNRLPKFTPNGTTIGSSNYSDDGLGGRYNIPGTSSYLAFYAGGNTYLRLQRASNNKMEFNLGNAGASQPAEITTNNAFGFEFISTAASAYMSFKVGSSSIEGLRVLSNGKLMFTQTPDTGTTSDSILVRDSSGNVKIVPYPTIPSLSGYVPYTGATANVDLGEYQLKAGQIEFDQTPTGTAGVAIMRWNDQDGTVDLGLKGGNVTLQIGQESVIRVVNKTATNINLLESNYQAVRVTGAQGNRLKVDLAQATTDALSAETIGLVTETINNNQEGFITTSGLVRNIDTTGTLQGETWADGDMLYLSPTVAGQVTNIKPSAPNHLIVMGYVVRAHATQGQIFVKVDNGYELDELHNVKITGTPTNNQTLAYNSSLQLWENKNLVIKVASVTLTPGSWSLVGGYYQSTYTNANIVSTGYINFTPNNASALEVTTSKMLPEITANNGNCVFYSQFPPQSDITGELIINIL